jgi:hypothetical protein
MKGGPCWSRFFSALHCRWVSTNAKSPRRKAATQERTLRLGAFASLRSTTERPAPDALRTFLSEYSDLAPAALLLYAGEDTFWVDRRVLAVPWHRVI